MKPTIHKIQIDAAKAIILQPKPGKGVLVSLNLFGASMGAATLTLDQCEDLQNALKLAREQAAA